MDLESVWETSGNITLLPPRGFVAVVQIERTGATRPMIALTLLRADKQRPFGTAPSRVMVGLVESMPALLKWVTGSSSPPSTLNGKARTVSLSSLPAPRADGARRTLSAGSR